MYKNKDYCNYMVIMKCVNYGCSCMFFSCIETNIGRSYSPSYNNCAPNINKPSARVCQGGCFASLMIFLHFRYSLFLEKTKKANFAKRKSETKLPGFKSLFMGNVVHTRGWCVYVWSYMRRSKICRWQFQCN